jgi:hypothetical protein
MKRKMIGKSRERERERERGEREWAELVVG